MKHANKSEKLSDLKYDHRSFSDSSEDSREIEFRHDYKMDPYPGDKITKTRPLAQKRSEMLQRFSTALCSEQTIVMGAKVSDNLAAERRKDNNMYQNNRQHPP